MHSTAADNPHMDSHLNPTQPCHPSGLEHRTFGACSVLLFVCRHPRLVQCSNLCHPCKTCILLRHTEVQAVEELLGAIPVENARGIFRHLLQDLNRRHFFDVVAPLLNATECRQPLILCLQRLEPSQIVEVLIAVPPAKLKAVMLGAPPEALVAVIRVVDTNRVHSSLIPILQEPDSILTGKLVPLLKELPHPEHLGSIVNACDSPAILLWIIRGVEVGQLVGLLSHFEPDDFVPDSNVVQLLRDVALSPNLVDEKLLPIMNRLNPEKVVPLIRGVQPSKLLTILENTDADGVVRLCEHTNINLAIRLMNGPLDLVLAQIAGGLAGALQNPLAARFLRHGSDALSAGVEHALTLKQNADQALERGKASRGAGTNDSYRFGDLTRGLLQRHNPQGSAVSP